MELLQLGAHLRAQRRVEVRERLVEEERLRAPHERAPEGDALPLPARELARLAFEQVRDLETLGRLARRARRSSPAATCAFARGKPRFSRTRHVRVERVALEDHRDVAIAGRALGDVDAVDRGPRRTSDARARREVRAASTCRTPRGRRASTNSPSSISRSMLLTTSAPRPERLRRSRRGRCVAMDGQPFTAPCGQAGHDAPLEERARRARGAASRSPRPPRSRPTARRARRRRG